MHELLVEVVGARELQAVLSVGFLVDEIGVDLDDGRIAFTGGEPLQIVHRARRLDELQLNPVRIGARTDRFAGCVVVPIGACGAQFEALCVGGGDGEDGEQAQPRRPCENVRGHWRVRLSGTWTDASLCGASIRFNRMPRRSLPHRCGPLRNSALVIGSPWTGSPGRMLFRCRVRLIAGISVFR